ncbi:hypothetical protein BDN72DRAFT_530437 [Pluteus cervinus]|uniref:Uncharacterized protein n=1 Tax=Pluteus cervinus TaxID=181527 RepID=A0ACD3AXW0_9AGAR|nr:hypothetical protein BDN72DRAFT_530437 [Pluteus cervinus]
MSPNAAAGHHRYHNTGVDPRYHSSQGTAVASSSQVSDPGYPAQTGYYEYSSTHPQAHPPPQPPSPQYIPPTSELARSAYPSYPHPPHPHTVPPTQPSRHVQPLPIPRSPTEPYTNPDFPVPHHIVPSSQSAPIPSQAQKLSRISTSRLRASTSSNSQSPTSASSPPGERFPCEKCGKTFSRSHDRKRHHETQHLPCPVVHRCRYCEKEFSRADSLKRHLDNGCDEMP